MQFELKHRMICERCPLVWFIVWMWVIEGLKLIYSTNAKLCFRKLYCASKHLNGQLGPLCIIQSRMHSWEEMEKQFLILIDFSCLHSSATFSLNLCPSCCLHSTKRQSFDKCWGTPPQLLPLLVDLFRRTQNCGFKANDTL